MKRKDTNPFLAARTHWWTAPVRLPAATLKFLGTTALARQIAHHPWLRQTPAKVRAPLES